MIERHYGQTNVLVGIEHETAKRKKLKRAGIATYKAAAPVTAARGDDLVPVGAVDLTPVDDGGED